MSHSSRLVLATLTLRAIVLAAVTGGAVTFAAPTARGADVGDYAPTSDEWSGLSYLALTAEEAHVELDWRTELDWQGIDRGDVLLLLYPLAPPEAATLRAFVEDGGRAVVADDFGSAAPLLDAFGLAREPAPPFAESLYGGHPAFPEFPLPDADAHFLFFHTDRVVGNHPAALTIRDGANCVPIISWPGAGAPALVAECGIGDGRLLAIADASLFINEMLRGVHGDKQFVANVLRYYCGPDECRVTVALPRARWTGRFRPGPPDVVGLDSFFRASVATVDHLLTDANDALRRVPIMPWLGLFACLFVLVRVRSARRSARTDFHGYHAAPIPHASAAEIRARTLFGRRRADFSEPLSLLRRRIEEALPRLTGAARTEAGALLTRIGDRPAAPHVQGRRLNTVSAGEFLALYRESWPFLNPTPRRDAHEEAR